MKCIILGNGRKIGLTRYVAAWRACKTLPPQTWIGPGVSGWGETAGEALQALRAGLDDRINRHIAGYGIGRKWTPDWQRAVLQAAHQINTPRLIIRWLPADLMKVATLKARVAEGRAA